MLRTFTTSKIRPCVSLDGLWCMTANDREWQVYVPGCRETVPGLENYRGVSVYERTVEAEGNLLFTFSGVSHTARICLDGIELGRHEGAYTGFSVLAADVKPGEHRLAVEVDNSFGEANALSIPNDYMTYGGITRSCRMEKIGSAYLSHLQLIPYKSGEDWMLEVRVRLNGASGITSSEVVCILEGTERILGEASVGAGMQKEFRGRFPVRSPRIYTPENPAFTYVRCVLRENGKDIDDLIERTGLRTIRAEGTKILFNDQPVRIRGFNRHEDHGLFGSSLPPAAMVQDLQLIRDLGGNAVRTSHYPNDPYFLDLCDEMGILVWEESHARGLSEEQMHHPLFLRQSRQCIEEMILRDSSHPCIFIWGLLNECASCADSCRPIYQELIGLIHSLDPSRPVTYATCYPGSEVTGEKPETVKKGFSDGDQCLDLCDVVSFNSYPGWYHNAPCKEYLEKVRTWARQHGGENKPYIVSEIGAGAIYGFRSRTNDKWSEERQADLLQEQLEAIVSNEDTCGVFIWQFADCRVSSECFYGRPRTMNNKGILDEYRRPKLAADNVRNVLPNMK